MAFKSFAVVVLQELVVNAMLWKLVAEAVNPAEIEPLLGKIIVPYRNSILLEVSYSHSWKVELAGPVLFHGMVTSHCTFKMRLGAVPVTTDLTLPLDPVARSSQKG